MRKGENPSNVLSACRAKIASSTSHLLPKGVRSSPFYDRT